MNTTSHNTAISLVTVLNMYDTNGQPCNVSGHAHSTCGCMPVTSGNVQHTCGSMEQNWGISGHMHSHSGCILVSGENVPHTCGHVHDLSHCNPRINGHTYVMPVHIGYHQNITPCCHACTGHVSETPSYIDGAATGMLAANASISESNQAFTNIPGAIVTGSIPQISRPNLYTKMVNVNNNTFILNADSAILYASWTNQPTSISNSTVLDEYNDKLNSNGNTCTLNATKLANDGKELTQIVFQSAWNVSKSNPHIAIPTSHTPESVIVPTTSETNIPGQSVVSGYLDDTNRHTWPSIKYHNNTVKCIHTTTDPIHQATQYNNHIISHIDDLAGQGFSTERERHGNIQHNSEVRPFLATQGSSPEGQRYSPAVPLTNGDQAPLNQDSSKSSNNQGIHILKTVEFPDDVTKSDSNGDTVPHNRLGNRKTMIVDNFTTTQGNCNMAHGQTTQTEEKQHQCIPCAKTFSSQTTLNHHMLIHREHKSFGHRSVRKKHELVHMGQKPQTLIKKPHSCRYCEETFEQVAGLNNHMLTHTYEKPELFPGSGQTFELKSALIGERTIPTQQITGTYREGENVLSYKCDPDKRKAIPKGQKPHVCTHCGKMLTRKHNFNTHRLTPLGQKPHVCEDCGKAFADKSYLKKNPLIHTGENRHVCTDCGKAFKRKWHLKRHILIHTAQKPHVCTDCGKAFTRKSTLKTHILIHTGQRSHVCTHCGKAFRHKSNLKTHILIHTGQKPHVCTECGKAFRGKSNLNTHVLIHKGQKRMYAQTAVKPSDTNLISMHTC